MLLDDEERLVELFMDNVIWGNVQIKLSAFEAELGLPNEQRISYRMGVFSRLRRDKIKNKEYTEIVAGLHSFFTLGRILGDVVGELRDRDHEQTVKELKEKLETAVSIIADQKKELSQLYKESPDKKNIRGIS